MPTLVHGVLIVGGSIAFALVAHTLVRRRVAIEVLEAHNEVAGVLIALVGGIYGILLAFVVVLVWDRWNEAREGAAAEANAVADLYRISEGLPEPVGERFRSEAIGYLETLIARDWPAMEHGRGSPELNAVSRSMWRQVTSFQPADHAQRNLHLAALDATTRVSDERRRRLMIVTQHVPPLLWGVLICGGLVTIAFTNFFGLRYGRSKAVMSATLAAIVGLVLFTIYALDHPYQGDLKLDARDAERALELLRAGG